MKLKNLAFFGVMGAILSVAGANAATGDNYLTTKGYVDARDSATLQAAVDAAATAAQTAGYITKDVNDLTNYYTKTTADGKYDASGAASTAETNAKTYTDTEIGKLNSSETATAGSALTGITITNGKITAKTEAVIPAAQVQSDWNATTGMGEILNKPTLGALAAKSTVGTADIDNGAVTAAKIAADAAIAKTQLASDVQTSLTAADNAAPQSTTYTKTEVDTALGQKQDTLTFDNAPTASSDNPVKSGGVYTALAGKQDTVGDATVSATDNKVVTGVTTTAGVVTAVSSSLIANANVDANAAIAPSKLNLGTCDEGRDCILTYGANGYVATPITKDGVDYNVSSGS